MKIYIGNCQPKIDCDALINEIKQHTVEPYYGNMDLDSSNRFYEDHLIQKRQAEEALAG
mgnify:CR=1 FL=1